MLCSNMRKPNKYASKLLKIKIQIIYTKYHKFPKYDRNGWINYLYLISYYYFCFCRCLQNQVFKWIHFPTSIFNRFLMYLKKLIMLFVKIINLHRRTCFLFNGCKDIFLTILKSLFIFSPKCRLFLYHLLVSIFQKERRLFWHHLLVPCYQKKLWFFWHLKLNLTINGSHTYAVFNFVETLKMKGISLHIAYSFYKFWRVAISDSKSRHLNKLHQTILYEKKKYFIRWRKTVSNLLIRCKISVLGRRILKGLQILCNSNYCWF